VIRRRVGANVVLEAALLALVDQRECAETTDAGLVEAGKTPSPETAPVNGLITNRTGHDASSPSQTIMVTDCVAVMDMENHIIHVLLNTENCRPFPHIVISPNKVHFVVSHWEFL
jgi:hypothetical protein